VLHRHGLVLPKDWITPEMENKRIGFGDNEAVIHRQARPSRVT